MSDAMAHLRYCPACAGALEVRLAGYPASPHPACTVCDFVLWQNPKPSVEALIVRDGPAGLEVLLGHRRDDTGHEVWDAPGGFLNLGDEPEPALVRECLREVGVTVRVGELIGAYTEEFAGGTLALYYSCEIADGEPRAADIVDAVAWFPVTEPPALAYASIGLAIQALSEGAAAGKA